MPAAQDLRYIAVEGPIGAGKTTLAQRLAERLEADVLLEAPLDNPFLARFYENQRAWALSAQLSFLLQRAEQMSELRQADMFRTVRVADFMLDKDRLFAIMNLDADELDLYEQVYARVIDEVPRPDLVIYLQTPVPVLVERIALRGIPFEQGMATDYLQRVAATYAHFFSAEGISPFRRVLVVNAADADFLNRDDHLARLVERLGSLPEGMEYFDPVSLV